MENPDKVKIVKEAVTTYPNFPKRGIIYRDIFGVLRDVTATRALKDLLVEHALRLDIDVIVGLDSRGFLLGPLISVELGKPFLPIRKKGKLPGQVARQSYKLEYGEATFEIQTESISEGTKVLIVDDLLATGGTMGAAIKLLNDTGAVIVECLVVMELISLDGRLKMSAEKCINCGLTEIDIDPVRGSSYCTQCGTVQQEQIIVSETTFEEAPAGNMMVMGHFVGHDSTGGASSFGAAYHVQGKESREITIQNAKKGITHLCLQLRLNQHCIETSVGFYKQALSRQLTRGRKQAHNHAACVYITCRTEGTAHMLIDISDVLQICVHELGRTYLRFTQALCLTIPSVDPCLYILRFANKLEFGDKTHEVSMTALRVVQRMKRDSIHSGRRPSGLCGAALLMAARLHEFNRTPADIIKIVKVHESTLRKRLIEFGDTPSSALTLEEFMTVDLEEEQDPPAFKAARKKDRERLQKLEDIDDELNDLQCEIDRQLSGQKLQKGKRKRDETTDEYLDTERFVKESNLSIIENCMIPDDPDEPAALRQSSVDSGSLITGLGPDIALMGLTAAAKDKESADKLESPFANPSGLFDPTGLDDDEIDSYIMSEKEANLKIDLWKTVNADYLEQQKEKAEKLRKEKEEGKPEKKKRRTNVKRNKNQTTASTAGEAIEKMLQEKRISTKINYEVLRSLNVGTPNNTSGASEDVTVKAEDKLSREQDLPKATTKGNESEISTKVGNQTERPRKSKNISSPEKSKIPNLPKNSVDEPAVSENLDGETSDTAIDNEEFADDEIELNSSEMTVSQMLGHHADDDDDGYGYGYDEEEY